MKFDDYLKVLPSGRKLSSVKLQILKRLWSSDSDAFPKPWVSSAELLTLTNQKYFDRRTRELRDQLGCELETSYREEFSGHAWRLASASLASPQNRDYLSQAQKLKLFDSYDYHCATCGRQTDAGVRGLQADHKIPLSRGGSNDMSNWQPMCNNCNVGKRRACEGCQFDCEVCSWAFPEKVGIKTMIDINQKILDRINHYSKNTGCSLDSIFEKAAEYYLETKK